MSESWEERLKNVYDLMLDMSTRTDPQDMVRAYGARVNKLSPTDRRLSLSRRDLESPAFLITRDSNQTEDINPWKEKHRLPRLSGGLLADLIYGGQPRIIDDLYVPDSDPAAEYLREYRSLAAIPMLAAGQSLNMVVLLKTQPAGFNRERFPDVFWTANLFGQATHNLVLKQEVREAYESVDRELRVVGEIQKALLPTATPRIPTLDLAADYRTSRRAGGDYYDFFPLPEGRWGILVADVSGHGTPAAVMMAITHSIAHLFPNETGRPGDLLDFVNTHLAGRYTTGIEAFVTAFYGVYDPAARSLTYASAGHNPPRLWKCSEQAATSINSDAGPPLGVDADSRYPDTTIHIQPGDRIVFYTDGITEAMNPLGEMFGVERVDEVLKNSCRLDAATIRDQLLRRLEEFTTGLPALDDRTVVVASAC
ncbi:MAG: PP2C family protein-serine/threonine phosphatase [Planctomyces sp.]|nr:PP2C family protein-serine/threonine phosphatase [Planctomyces sp.]